jgi:hypothetical protein
MGFLFYAQNVFFFGLPTERPPPQTLVGGNLLGQNTSSTDHPVVGSDLLLVGGLGAHFICSFFFKKK